MMDTDLTKLDELLLEEDRNGYEFRPTRYAYDSAKAHLLAAEKILGDRYFSPSIEPDGCRDISLDWEVNPYYVSVYCVPKASSAENQGDAIFIGYALKCERVDYSDEKLEEALKWLLSQTQ
jgi:hypothetical protein